MAARKNMMDRIADAQIVIAVDDNWGFRIIKDRRVSPPGPVMSLQRFIEHIAGRMVMQTVLAKTAEQFIKGRKRRG